MQSELSTTSADTNQFAIQFSKRPTLGDAGIVCTDITGSNEPYITYNHASNEPYTTYTTYRARSEVRTKLMCIHMCARMSARASMLCPSLYARSCGMPVSMPMHMYACVTMHCIITMCTRVLKHAYLQSKIGPCSHLGS